MSGGSKDPPYDLGESKDSPYDLGESKDSPYDLGECKDSPYDLGESKDSPYDTEEGPMRDFAVRLTHRPGELARVAAALSRYGVNIKSVSALAIDNYVLARILADDVEAARSALEESNIRFEEAEIVTVLLENRAGELAKLCTKLSDAGVNLQGLYLIGIVDDLVELAIVSDNPKKAKKLLE